MRHTLVAVLIAGSVVAVSAYQANRAVAADEGSDTEIRIEAPLDRADCMANTISVLGLTIDISTAAFSGGGGSADQSGTEDGGDSNGGSNGQTGCAALIAGQPVKVQLSSDSTALSATAVDQGDGGEEVKIEAPVQNVDTTNNTLTVLGLMVDVSQANLDGADDNSEDGNSQAIDLNQIMAGQFVEMTLASSQAPLAATEIQVKNFSNQVEVEVEDANGEPIDDTDTDVEVDVTETVVVKNPVAGTTAPRRIKRTVHLHRLSSGSVSLSGLPRGRAKVAVTRSAGGFTSTGRRSVGVRANSMRQVRLRLHPSN